MFDLDLPINDILEPIREHLAHHDTLIVEAPPGAGKTTLVPLALLNEDWVKQRRIVMLQPRRLAVRNAALRMASLLGETPGQTVGYRMRLDTKISAQTRIEVVTEGVLLRMLREDPSLSDTAALIFDEFHERSLDADLGLTLSLNARRMFERDSPVRIILMSATLDEHALADFLQARCIRSDGRMFAVEEKYGQASQARERIAERAGRAIQQAVSEHPQSSFLVFLPGQGEIRAVATELALPADVSVHPLYGDLSITEQQAAIDPCAAGRRKVVLATNIAETSLTIEGVDVVIDSGLERKPVFDPNTGMSRLHTVKISRASSEQRKGRAGRLRPGTCYRLWSASQQKQLDAQREPEIRNADLAAMALQLFAWGSYDPLELSWLTPPPSGAFQQALDLLQNLGAIRTTDTGLRLTPHGDSMANITVHPRLAHMLLAGQSIGAPDTAAQLAAVLSDRDPVSRESSDMRLRLEYLSGESACPPQFRGWQMRTLKLADQFLHQLPPGTPSILERPPRDALPGYLIACAYPDRVARRRHAGGFQLANGRSCNFDTPNPLSKEKWLAVAEVSGMLKRRGDIIRAAAPLSPALFESLLKNLVAESSLVDWDSKAGRFVAERRRSCGALLLGRESLPAVSDDARVAKLIELTRSANMSNLPWRDDTQDYLHRARLMGSLVNHWPSFEHESLLDTLSSWLAPFLTPVRKLGDFKQLNVLEALKARLSWEQQQQLESYLPERYKVPSGSWIKINYSQSPPTLPVKLQEMFGCDTTPAVASGRIALVVHLLSPAARPLQVTQDLVGFWKTGYREVRKEMKGRYPKHPWPEDPITAEPTRHTKTRSSS